MQSIMACARSPGVEKALCLIEFLRVVVERHQIGECAADVNCQNIQRMPPFGVMALSRNFIRPDLIPIG